MKPCYINKCIRIVGVIILLHFGYGSQFFIRLRGFPFKFQFMNRKNVLMFFRILVLVHISLASDD